MSMTRPVSLTCPECSEIFAAELYASVNADRAPELREAVLDGSFQRFSCACGVSIGVESEELSYLDTQRKQWLVARPYEELPNWARHEASTQALFEQALGSGAPAVAQEIGAGISPRLVFGLNAWREKLIVNDAGLDDVVLEALKMRLMRDQQIVPEAGLELRLTAVEDEGATLKIENLEASSGDSRGGYGVPRQAYEEVASDSGWAPLRDQIGAGCYVDAQRLYYGD